VTRSPPAASGLLLADADVHPRNVTGGHSATPYLRRVAHPFPLPRPRDPVSSTQAAPHHSSGLDDNVFGRAKFSRGGACVPSSPIRSPFCPGGCLRSDICIEDLLRCHCLRAVRLELPPVVRRPGGFRERRTTLDPPIAAIFLLERREITCFFDRAALCETPTSLLRTILHPQSLHRLFLEPFMGGPAGHPTTEVFCLSAAMNGDVCPRMSSPDSTLRSPTSDHTTV